jgi:L-histidine N-alpha-methyltransferase
VITETTARYSSADLASEVRLGLTQQQQKELPSKYLYDEVGSALFDVITLLPEYGLSRADERLLREHAEAMVRPLFPAPIVVAELGSGSGKKTRWILQALARRQTTPYYPIEISPAALSQCTKELGQLDRVSIVGIERAYLEGLAAVAANRRPGERMLVLFLGSTIGNFDRPAAEQFLAEVRATLLPGDALLLGTDLEKPLDQLIPAYDDPLGVTASFNLNLLVRINRELAADFDLAAFEHVARYNQFHRRIEMHLMSRYRQHVSIPGAGCGVLFDAGETIWTESSYKYRPADVAEIVRGAGFHSHAQWVDAEWPFAESLVIAE